MDTCDGDISVLAAFLGPAGLHCSVALTLHGWSIYCIYVNLFNFRYEQDIYQCKVVIEQCIKTVCLMSHMDFGEYNKLTKLNKSTIRNHHIVKKLIFRNI